MTTTEKDLTVNETCSTNVNTCSSEKQQVEASVQKQEVQEAKKEEKIKSGSCGCS